MARDRVEFGEVRTKCSCFYCTANCKRMPGYYIPQDLERLVPMEIRTEPGKVMAWARKNLRASRGALIGYQLADGTEAMAQVKTLVPAHRADGSCIHLKAGHCEIHANAPFGCAFFNCRQSKQEGNALSAKGLEVIMEDAQRRGPYSRLWNMLWEEGLRSPEPNAKRKALNDYIKEYQNERRRRLGLSRRPRR